VALAAHNPTMQRETIAILAALPDEALNRRIGGNPLQIHLYAALRREQRAVVTASAPAQRESTAILSFARSAYEELVALLVDRDVLDVARDDEWTLRDLMRHAIAVELRYCEQVLWSAHRHSNEPLGIPAERLPCDRLAPPVPEFADAVDGDMSRVLELLGRARRSTDERLADLPAELLERPSQWGSAQIDVRERLHQVGAHLVEVTVQAEKMLGATDSEARRVVRRIAATRGIHEALSDPSDITRLDIELERLVRADLGHS
jgi:hypothetical protein